MKKISILIITLIIASPSFAAWNLVWQDEFNGTGLPDANKWGYDTGNGGWGNYELQNYTANRTENARQENGNLVIEARRDWHNGIEYSSARLVSKNKGDWKYGRIEVRAKIPLGQGLWPAIWMLPTDWVYGGWPASGEIDIMENFALGGIKPNSIEGNVHTQAYNHTMGTNKGAKKDGLANIEDNFHVYAVNWYEDKIDFEVDGITYFTFQNEGYWEAWPFDQRFHMILNIAVGGTLGTTPDPNIFPKQMLVDYVRVYEQDNGPQSTIGFIATGYNDCNYSGFSGGFNSVGDYDLAALETIGLEANKLSSINIAEGFKMQIYDQDNFTGNSSIITTNSNCLNGWNDRIKSLRIIPNGDPNIEGFYYLNNRSTGKTMDVAGGESAINNGTNIFQWFKTETENQQFQFTHLGNGVYKIIALHSGRSLDIDAHGTINGSNIIQWDYLGGSNQQFVVYPTGDGYYKLIALNSAKIIEVDPSLNGDGANIQLWENLNQLNGHWELEQINLTNTSEFQIQASIFPNPCIEYLNVNIPDKNVSGIVTDLSGKVVVSIDDFLKPINTIDLPQGIYILRFLNSPIEPVLFIKN